jgi:hypothetical protein
MPLSKDQRRASPRGCDKSMLLARGRAALVERDRDVIVGNRAIDLA